MLSVINNGMLLNWGRSQMSATFACSFINGIACYFLTSAITNSTGIFSATVTLTTISTTCKTSDGKYWKEDNFFLAIGT